MKTKTMIIAALVLSLVLALSPAVLARGFGPDCGHPHGVPGMMKLRAVLDLNLTDAQREQVRTIVDSYDKQRTPARDTIERARRGFIDAKRADKFNEETVRQAFRKYSTTREEMIVSRGKMMSELKAVLTPEQRAQLEERKRFEGHDRERVRKDHGRRTFDGDRSFRWD
ncbi:MAG: Spy/CpxP family protein refolding chaperone [Deltaproteobacteria bacterium]|nr:Spy/CpxP family protein refolding chaperone [Deltaproteobacteria bacterium]